MVSGVSRLVLSGISSNTWMRAPSRLGCRIILCSQYTGLQVKCLKLGTDFRYSGHRRHTGMVCMYYIDPEVGVSVDR
jgi:hypothetical protein